MFKLYIKCTNKIKNFLTVSLSKSKVSIAQTCMVLNKLYISDIKRKIKEQVIRLQKSQVIAVTFYSTKSKKRKRNRNIFLCRKNETCEYSIIKYQKQN